MPNEEQSEDMDVFPETEYFRTSIRSYKFRAARGGCPSTLCTVGIVPW